MPKQQKIVLPEDAREALRDAGVLSAFGQLSLAQQREYTLAIENADGTDARLSRIDEMVAALRDGKP
jgi:uncharacterized protein YdeI (YjbR/CyaY-like superfamily)